MTRSVKPELNGSFMHADQLHPAVEIAQTRSYAVERPYNAGFQVIGMQRIKKKQAADDRVISESVDDFSARCFRMPA
jgi:hypothetical protein